MKNGQADEYDEQRAYYENSIHGKEISKEFGRISLSVHEIVLRVILRVICEKIAKKF